MIDACVGSAEVSITEHEGNNIIRQGVLSGNSSLICLLVDKGIIPNPSHLDEMVATWKVKADQFEKETCFRQSFFRDIEIIRMVHALRRSLPAVKPETKRIIYKEVFDALHFNCIGKVVNQKSLGVNYWSIECSRYFFNPEEAALVSEIAATLPFKKRVVRLLQSEEIRFFQGEVKVGEKDTHLLDPFRLPEMPASKFYPGTNRIPLMKDETKQVSKLTGPERVKRNLDKDYELLRGMLRNAQIYAQYSSDAKSHEHVARLNEKLSDFVRANPGYSMPDA